MHTRSAPPPATARGHAAVRYRPAPPRGALPPTTTQRSAAVRRLRAAAARYAADTLGPRLLPLLVADLLLWTALSLAVAAWLFRRRDVPV